MSQERVIVFRGVIVTVLLAGTASAQPLTLDEAIAIAMQNSHEVRAADLDRDRASEERKSTLGQMGPKLGLSWKAMWWDAPTDISLPFQVPDAIKQMGFDFPNSMHVMDRETRDISLRVAQPLTPLYSLFSLYKLQGAQEESAKFTAQKKAKDLAYKVAEAYFSILKLRKAKETILKAREQVEAHMRTAKAFFEQGYVQKDDLLRAEVAMAQVEERLHQVETATALAMAGLNVLMGRRMEEPFEVVDQYPDPPRPLEMGEEEALQRAMERRPEIRDMEAKVEMAKAARHASIGAMLPTLSAVFTWDRQWGNKFQRDRSWFVGLILDWNFFEWGSQFYKVKAAEKAIAMAEEGKAGISQMVALEVKQAYLQAQLAWTSLETARKAVALAEESYRIATKKYEQRLATSMEVLDAESALTASRNAYYEALYSYYLALENLRRATGDREVGR